jgi:hypothetical protein
VEVSDELEPTCEPAVVAVVIVGLGVHRPVLPGVNETLLHENPPELSVKNTDASPPPVVSRTPDDHGRIEDVVWFVALVVLEIRNWDELVLAVVDDFRV